MSDGWWIAIAIVVAVWLLWGRASSRPSSTAKVAPSRPLADTAPEVKRELGDVQAAKQAHEEVSRAERDAMKRHQKDMESTNQKTDRARQYMKDTGLDQTLPALWDAVEHWPHWIKLPEDRQWNPPPGISGITGGGDRKDRTSAWDWQGHRYSMRFEERHNYIPDDYDRRGEITLEVDEANVCTVSCSRGSESYETWYYTDVEALTVGPWMADVVKLAGALKQDQDRRMRETSAKWQKDKADRFHLD